LIIREGVFDLVLVRRFAYRAFGRNINRRELSHLAHVEVLFLMRRVGDAVFDDHARIDAALRHRVVPDWFAGADLHRRDRTVAPVGGQRRRLGEAPPGGGGRCRVGRPPGGGGGHGVFPGPFAKSCGRRGGRRNAPRPGGPRPPHPHHPPGGGGKGRPPRPPP